MRKLIVLSSGNVNALNGASKFCKYLTADEHFWEERGIKIILSSNSESFDSEPLYRNSLKYKIKQLIKTALNKTRFGKRIKLLKYDIGFLGASPVRSVQEELDENTWVLLNDINVASVFYREFGAQYKTIFMMHNGGDLTSMLSDIMSDNYLRDYYSKLEKLIFKSASFISFVSETAKDCFINNHPQYKTKSVCIYNGIKAITGNKSERSIKSLDLVSVGTLCKRKNQLELVQAIKELCRSDISLTLVGGGPEYETIKEYVTENGLENQIQLVGPQTDVTHYLLRANAFILVSHDEGLPISAQEALSAELPIIITDVGGCRNLVQCNNGLLIHPCLEEEKQAISYFADHISDLKIMGKRSYELFSRNFTLEIMRENYYKLISQSGNHEQ